MSRYNVFGITSSNTITTDYARVYNHGLLMASVSNVVNAVAAHFAVSTATHEDDVTCGAEDITAAGRLGLTSWVAVPTADATVGSAIAVGIQSVAYPEDEGEMEKMDDGGSRCIISSHALSSTGPDLSWPLSPARRLV